MIYVLCKCKENGRGFLSTPISSHPSKEEAKKAVEEYTKILKKDEWLEVKEEASGGN